MRPLWPLWPLRPLGSLRALSAGRALGTGGSFRTRAAVRHAYIGADAVGRLNLMFLDEQAPDRLLSQ